jgi:hypothetical protein
MVSSLVVREVRSWRRILLLHQVCAINTEPNVDINTQQLQYVSTLTSALRHEAQAKSTGRSAEHVFAILPGVNDRAVKLAPSILAADFSRLGEQVRAAELGGADYIHIDVMDGRFVPNITIGPLVVQACKRITRLPLDIHLMIVEPERYI